MENKIHQAMAVMDNDTGQLLNYRQLMQSDKHKHAWSQSSANKFGRLASSSNMILMYTASRAIMCSPASSALVADDITFFMICAMFNTAQLFGGMGVSLDRKKCPPARLRAPGSLK